MRTAILRALRAEARDWWAHRDLQRRGLANEAARRERASVRSHLEVIRKALTTRDAYVSAGRGGTTVHFGRGSTLSSYGRLEHMAAARVLIALGLPFIDTNPVEDKWQLVGLPLVATGMEPDDPPWGSMGYAPLAVYAARAKALGAVIVNLEVDEVREISTVDRPAA
ncbi:hypothetical protein [Roseitranquillus sediminis]|uniref:hypothetical protein n=1 Tax=Roseitranquillus sediminis TaxID=2809051 RepID=UPI001D0CA91F|nr:hypothetical protein [Roseitranquillus sediminis]MBM9595095.1 hypothetical protein [Roseitranquillus sediminis]